MSFFENNSENRNSGMRNTLLTRINTRINRNSLMRCSFCCRYGHNVIDCNDIGFMTISADLINNKRKIINDRTISYNDKKDVFCADLRYEAELSENKKRRLKCYAIRYCDAGDEDDYFTWSMKICNKIYEMTYEEEERIISNITTPDYLEFDENDAVNYLIDADNLIRENNVIRNLNVMSERDTRYTESGLRLLSFIAQIRMDEMLDEMVRLPFEDDYNNCNNDNKHVLECCIDSNVLENDLNKLNECSICYEEKSNINFVKVNCSHEFCCGCMKKTIDTTNTELKCPLCRTKITSLKFKNKEICENF